MIYHFNTQNRLKHFKFDYTTDCNQNTTILAYNRKTLN